MYVAKISNTGVLSKKVSRVLECVQYDQNENKPCARRSLTSVGHCSMLTTSLRGGITDDSEDEDEDDGGSGGGGSGEEGADGGGTSPTAPPAARQAQRLRAVETQRKAERAAITNTAATWLPWQNEYRLHFIPFLRHQNLCSHAPPSLRVPDSAFAPLSLS